MVEGGGAAGSNESQQISLAEMLLGDQDQNMLAWKLLGAVYCAEEACGKLTDRASPDSANCSFVSLVLANYP